MEITHFDQDITAMYLEAKSFPEGVLAAHQALHAKVPYAEERGYYGISWLEDGKIRYLAAAAELAVGEAKQLELEIFTIKKGSYICEMLPDFQMDIPSIGKTFEKMLDDSRIDPKGYCLEIYSKDSKDMQCLVKLKD